MTDINTELLRTISKALNHNFFIDLAYDSRLGDIKAKSIKMKDLSEWVIDYVYESIHEIHCEEPQAKDLNKWAKKFSRFDAQCFVWENSLLELKSEGIDDDVNVSEIKATQYASNLVDDILQEWYIPKEKIPFMKLNKESIKIIEEHLQDIPIILKQEAIFNIQIELGSKKLKEKSNNKVEIPVWVHPHCFSELVGITTINFDNDCNIIGFKFDTSQSTL